MIHHFWRIIQVKNLQKILLLVFLKKQQEETLTTIEISHSNLCNMQTTMLEKTDNVKGRIFLILLQTVDKEVVEQMRNHLFSRLSM